jgi:hypothetical protein
MTDDACTFSFISAEDSAPKTATGIERSWLDLKLEFHRQGEGLPGVGMQRTRTFRFSEVSAGSVSVYEFGFASRFGFGFDHFQSINKED